MMELLHIMELLEFSYTFEQVFLTWWSPGPEAHLIYRALILVCGVDLKAIVYD